MNKLATRQPSSQQSYSLPKIIRLQEIIGQCYWQNYYHESDRHYEWMMVI